METEEINPLLNVHVIEKIFSTLKLPQLLKCRLVCQTWNDEALRILERRGITAFLKGDNAFINFTECVRNSPSHPFTSFAIDLPNNKDSDEVYELLDVINDRMKSLRFEYEPLIASPEEDENEELPAIDDGNVNVEEISESPSEIVVEQEVCNQNDTTEEVELPQKKSDLTLPVLTSLHLFSTNIFPPSSTNKMPQLFDLLKTLNLTSLSVQHLYATECSETVIKFLCCSTKPIYSLKIPCTEFPKICAGLKDQVNLTHLKELDICDLFHGSFATNQTIQCISETCPNLETLSIELGCRVNFENIYKLLETLSHSIVNLKLTIQDKNLLSRNILRVNWHFPKMPKLKSLFLRFANPGIVYYIDAMPQLTSLELETPWTRRVRGNIFPEGENRIYSSLKTLTLSEKLTVEDVIKMRGLYPNLKTLCSSFKSDEALLAVYKHFKQLENLIVDRNSNITDFGIYGLSGRKYLESKDEKDFAGEESYDPVGSIAELKCLKSLKLVQTGLTWRSMIFGVCFVKGLQTLAVQSTTLKMNHSTSILENEFVPKSLSTKLQKLENLTIWIRRNIERLTPSEMEYLSTNYSQWDVDVIIQTVCSTT